MERRPYRPNPTLTLKLPYAMVPHTAPMGEVYFQAGVPAGINIRLRGAFFLDNFRVLFGFI